MQRRMGGNFKISCTSRSGRLSCESRSSREDEKITELLKIEVAQLRDIAGARNAVHKDDYDRLQIDLSSEIEN